MNKNTGYIVYSRFYDVNGCHINIHIDGEPKKHIGIVPEFFTINEKISDALYLAIVHHEAVNQTRKHSGEPYVAHPIRVAKTVYKYTDNHDAIIVALLHDTLEDTNLKIDFIKSKFGDTVATNIEALTMPDKSVGNRATRKALYRKQIADASDVVKLIKIADMMDNYPSIAKYDPVFAKNIYLDECRQMFEIVKDIDYPLVDNLKIVLDLPLSSKKSKPENKIENLTI